MKIVGSFIKWAMRKRLTRLQTMRTHGAEMQAEQLNLLLNKARNTEWGKQYRYKEVRNFQEFASRTPVSTYEEFVPYFNRIMAGESSVLWPGKIKMFSKSSGTTNARSKFIPVSKDALHNCHYQGGRDMISFYLENKPESRVLDGKNLAVGGSMAPSDTNSNIMVGDVSALIMSNLPSWAEFIRTPKLEIALMNNWERKIDAICKSTRFENVTSLSGVPTWTVVLMKSIVEMYGAKHIHEIWPNLELFIHGAVSFDPYRDIFKALSPAKPLNFLETYNASEGYFGIQDDMNLPNELMLMLDYGIFYEFIPMDEVGRAYPNSVAIQDVEIGKNYAMAISTNAGLWRYLIGDTVRFTSKNPYRVKISGRTKQFINAFGEELIVENAETAIAKACKETGAVVSNYTAGPIFLNTQGKGAHEWLIEFEKEPTSLDAFTHLLDTELRAINSDYDAKRAYDISLQLPVVRSLPEGTFYKWMQKKGKLGGQHKVPRLANDRAYLDEILDIYQTV